MENEIYWAIEPVIRTYKKVKTHLTTLSLSQYNYYKDPLMPPAHTIMKKIDRSWQEILDLMGLPHHLNRLILARLSNSLHLLEKEIVKVLGLGWEEKSFSLPNYSKKMRPDEFCTERIYLHNSQFFILDVKLDVSSSSLTIYKYLPIFENPPVPYQMTFFSEWIPQSAIDIGPELQVYEDGQLGMFLEHNLLFICYLIGRPGKDLLPRSEISCGRVSSEKKKKLPGNMQVRFVNFFDLPELYCRLSGIDYDPDSLKNILKIVHVIKDLVLANHENAEEISEKIYHVVKAGNLSNGRSFTDSRISHGLW